MSRTQRNTSYRKTRNLRTVNTHYRPSGDKVDLKKYSSKYALRTYNNPEHSQFDNTLELSLNDEFEFGIYCDWEDKINNSILHDGINACRIRPCGSSKWSFSYLHELSFIRGIVDSSNTDEQVCVWKEH
jgi:hypothetical protein